MRADLGPGQERDAEFVRKRTIEGGLVDETVGDHEGVGINAKAGRLGRRVPQEADGKAVLGQEADFHRERRFRIPRPDRGAVRLTSLLEER